MRCCLSNKFGGWGSAKTGKGFFAQRLTAALSEIGVEMTSNPFEPVDADVQITRESYWPKNARKRIVRRGPVKYDTNIDYKVSNHKDLQYMESCHGIIYQSAFSKRLNDKFMYEPSKQHVAVIPNGVNIEYYDSIKEEREPALFLASTREWVWEKRLKDIVESFIVADIKGSKLVILGQVWATQKRFPPKQKDFQEKYSKHKNIVFGGCVGEAEVAKWLRRAAALVHLVYIDAQPNAVAEAIGAGLPVICTDQGGQAEAVRDCSAGIVIPETAFDFKAKDRRGGLPKADRSRVAAAMHEILKADIKINKEPISIKTIAQKYAAFFAEVCA